MVEELKKFLEKMKEGTLEDIIIETEREVRELGGDESDVLKLRAKVEVAFLLGKKEGGLEAIELTRRKLKEVA